ncbi:hypothetical protein DTO166G4_3766 [Paecilomyces variotii]|nr:hypothetical protein DTO166G4_3766 [Paecilomyces variotii]KAJ9232597.1 hypothetical protein DTO166G5_6193 [Paecilomyces variotii]KAJ9374830.1 hypothetical protein DTO282E5_385 [Paecilomyces variotii]
MATYPSPYTPWYPGMFEGKCPVIDFSHEEVTTTQGEAKNVSAHAKEEPITVSAHAKETPITGSYQPEEWEIQDIRPYLTSREWRIYLNCHPKHRSELMMKANDRANMETPPVLLGSISSEETNKEIPISQEDKRSNKLEAGSTSKTADLAAGNVDVIEDNVKSYTRGILPQKRRISQPGDIDIEDNKILCRRDPSLSDGDRV